MTDPLPYLASGQLQSQQQLLHLLQHELKLPMHHVVEAFGYGSAVLAQQQQQQQQQTQQHPTSVTAIETRINNSNCMSNNNNNAMVDLIVVVADAVAFHADNWYMNPHHYNGWAAWWATRRQQQQQQSKMGGKKSSSSNSNTNNLHHNSSDPENVALAAAQTLAWFQRHDPPYLWLGSNPKVYFNIVPSTASNTTPAIKYGIIQWDDDLQRDLIDWTHLYIAGRLQKPVIPILQGMISNNNNSSNTSSELMLGRHASRRTALWDAQTQHNLPAALATALLLHGRKKTTQSSPHVFSSHAATTTVPSAAAAAATTTTTTCTSIPLPTLLETVSSLSYSGDLRMQIGAEDPAKITQLVYSPGQITRWQMWYSGTLQRWHQQGLIHCEQCCTIPLDDNHDQPWQVEWNPHDTTVQHFLWQQLPVLIRQKCGYHRREVKGGSTHHHHHMSTAVDMLPQVLTGVVAPAARYQSLKGLCTTNISTSWHYVMRKLSKGWKKGR